MTKNLQVWILVVCFGLFIIPKQGFMSSKSSMDCCNTIVAKSSNNNSEHKTDKCHKESKNKNHCTGNCSNCDICHFASIVFHLPNSTIITDFSFGTQTKERKFNYTTPEISSVFSKIWQPPKIS
ncbi:MAG: hypothetical protein JST62_11795 [Bacteroidetes bacterium]|jgi:Icc-related predicted phosphoesterase|nr:hypothetical protein [Bacteroidota bacterium]